jgi:DNA invertase Pin-like site-specific DNA recombinase
MTNLIRGYARVSTGSQNLDHQLDALKNAGCEKIYTDQISGSIKERPGLDQLLLDIKPGDKVKVLRLDRLGRSMKDLLEIVNRFQDNNVEFISLTESIRTDSVNGRFFFHLAAALSEMEKELLRSRTIMGLEAARKRGRLGGRPKKINDELLEQIKKMLEGDLTVSQIAKTLSISRSTIYRALS